MRRVLTVALGFSVNTQAGLGADTLLRVDLNGDEDFSVLHTANYTPATTGLHYLVFFSAEGQGFRKIIVDDVSASGPGLNQAPLARLVYDRPTDLPIIEGATVPLNAVAVDNDGGRRKCILPRKR